MEKKGYADRSFTSVTNNWNKATKIDIEPKMIRDIIIRKKLRSHIGKNANTENVNPEEHTQDELHIFTSAWPAFHNISDESVSRIYNELYKITPESVGSTCILVDSEEEKNPLFSLNVVAGKIIQNVQDNETRLLKFLEALSCSGKAAKIIEIKKETIW